MCLGVAPSGVLGLFSTGAKPRVEIKRATRFPLLSRKTKMVVSRGETAELRHSGGTHLLGNRNPILLRYAM